MANSRIRKTPGWCQDVLNEQDARNHSYASHPAPPPPLKLPSYMSGTQGNNSQIIT